MVTTAAQVRFLAWELPQAADADQKNKSIFYSFIWLTPSAEFPAK